MVGLFISFLHVLLSVRNQPIDRQHLRNGDSFYHTELIRFFRKLLIFPKKIVSYLDPKIMQKVDYVC